MSIRTAHRTTGMRQARRFFRKLEKLGEDPRELLDAIGQTMTESAVRRLTTTNKAPDGTRWTPSRRAQFKGGRTQLDRGSAGLAGSITHRVIPGGVEVGSPLIYAAQRQFGGTIKAKPGRMLVFDSLDAAGNPIKVFARKVTQPARPYLGVSDDDADEIGGLALDFITDLFPDGRGVSP